MLLLYLKLIIKSYIALAHDSGFSITLKWADSGIKLNLLKLEPAFDVSKSLLSVFYRNYLDLCPGVKLDDSIPAIAQISSLSETSPVTPTAPIFLPSF